MFKGMTLLSTIFRLYGMLTEKNADNDSYHAGNKNNECLLTPNFTSGSKSYF